MPRLPKAELRRLVREEPFPTLTGVLRPMPELGAIFERCVQRDPAARFAHAGELSQALLALGPGDEEALREGAPEESAVGKGLPPNEVLGRIDMWLRGRSPALATAAVSAPASAPTPRVVMQSRRHAAAPPRSGVNGPLIVVVLAVIAIIGSLLYLRTTGRGSDPPAETQERGIVDHAPAPADAASQPAPESPR
jgi:hypothetical protein